MTLLLGTCRLFSMEDEDAWKWRLAKGTVLRHVIHGLRATITSDPLAGGGYYFMEVLNPHPHMKSWEKEFRLQPGHVGDTWAVEE